MFKNFILFFISFLDPQQQQMAGMGQRERIWSGILEWTDKNNQQNTTRQVPCQIFANMAKETNEVEV